MPLAASPWPVVRGGLRLFEAHEVRLGPRVSKDLRDGRGRGDHGDRLQKIKMDHEAESETMDPGAGRANTGRKVPSECVVLLDRKGSKVLAALTETKDLLGLEGRQGLKDSTANKGLMDRQA